MIFGFIKKCFLTAMTFFNPLDTEGGGGGQARWTAVGMFFLLFSYLLNFCIQWHLRKFLTLGQLSNHLFGLVFLCPTSKKMRVWVHWTPPQ